MPTDTSVEAGHLELFRRLAGSDFPHGSVTHSSRHEPAPDFVIQSQSWRVGIEHREVLLGDPSARRARAREGHIEEILREARQLAELTTTPRLVGVVFASQVPAARPGRLEVARTLADVVHRGVPDGEWSSVRLHAYRHFGRPAANFIQLVSLQHAPVHRWYDMRSGFVQEEAVALIQAAIEDKAGRYSRYRQACDECWLLLVCDSTRQSSAIEPNEETLAHRYAGPFDRLYLLDAGMGKLKRLNVA